MSKISEGVKETPAGLGSPSPAHEAAKKADVVEKTELKVQTTNGHANGVVEALAS